jgi:chemotaxis protein MotB
MAAKGGGAWKVAYADFVTAMMAFFMVMWISAQKSGVKEAVAQYFNDPFMLGPGSAASAPAAAAPALPSPPASAQPPATPPTVPKRSPPQPRAKPARGRQLVRPEGEKQRFLALHNGDRLMTGTVVLFPEGSAELDAEARKRLERLLPALLGKPNKIEIRGHASRQPLPSGTPFQDAWQLSYARCLATMEYLEHSGVEPQRMRLSQAGAFEPHTIRVEPEQQTQNSRVEVYVLGEFVEDLVGTREERDARSEIPWAASATEADLPPQSGQQDAGGS